MDNAINNTEKKVVGKPFKKGVVSNPRGRPKLTEEQKLMKKEMRIQVTELVTEHTKKLAKALPEIGNALIRKAKEGDVQAIKEVHSVIGAYPQTGNNVLAIQLNIGKERDEYAA